MTQQHEPLKLIECPRDAMQGIHRFIPTATKINYLNRLLEIGFDTLDFGSFVSPKAIPQMRDTAEVLSGLDCSKTSTKLLAIVANERGVKEASEFDEITYLGYPFSISEEFQKRNTNRSMEDSLRLVEHMKNETERRSKELVVYVSMGFGNPYREEWSPEIVHHWVEKLANLDVKTLSLSDTVGLAREEDIDTLFRALIPSFPDIEFGAHLHTTYENWRIKVDTAWNAGCRRFDGAIRGYGGCPMADDELVGNMPTEKLLTFAQEKKINSRLNLLAFESAYNMATEIFPG